MLLFDDKFPIKKFLVKTLGLSESDWILAQPKKSLSEIQKENTFVMLKEFDELDTSQIPAEVIRLFMIWKMDGFTNQTMIQGDDRHISIFPRKKLNVPKSPILRENFAKVFGYDVDWVKPKITGLQKVAMAWKSPQKAELMASTIKRENLEVPKWAIEK